MNSGTICISLAEPTAEALIHKLGRARPLADVVEIRFDRLEAAEIGRTLELLAELENCTPLLATYRPDDERSNTAFEGRVAFWQKVLATRLFQYVDFEDDLVFALTYNDIFEPELLADVAVIGSHHNFYETPPDIGPVLKVFEPADDSRFRCNAVKIATNANSITDTVELWYTLDWARHYGLQAIPIGMGEPGKWTRILGPAHGAMFTYASLDDETATAPGQLTARDLTDIYRVRDLTRDTRVYGVIAGDTSYSMSPYIQNAAIKSAAVDAVFVPLQVDDLRDFLRRMVLPDTREIELNFGGFAVTNPHKRSIIEYLDDIDDAARAIGAVNTVKVDHSRLIGTNTDAAGFIEPLLEQLGDLRGSEAAVYGAGGAARACVYALRSAGAKVSVHARDPQKAARLAEEFGVAAGGDIGTPDIFVNATPVGTRGHPESSVLAPGELDGIGLVYDLTYNPRETVLLRDAKAAGCKTLDGLAMLIAQGAKQFELLTGRTADRDAMAAVALDKLER